MSSQDSATNSELHFTNFVIQYQSHFVYLLLLFLSKQSKRLKMNCENSYRQISEFVNRSGELHMYMSGIQNSWYQLKMPSTCAFLHHCSYNFTFFLSSTCVWQINFLCLWRLFSLPSCQKIFISQFFYFSHHMYVKYMYELCKLPFWVSM